MHQTTFGTRLRQLRATKNVSQEQVAEACGVSQKAISNWENDAPGTSREDVVRLVGYFGCTADYLLGLSPAATALPPGHWIVDLDLVDQMRSGTEPPEEAWAFAIPQRCAILTSSELQKLQGEVRRRGKKT